MSDARLLSLFTGQSQVRDTSPPYRTWTESATNKVSSTKAPSAPSPHTIHVSQTQEVNPLLEPVYLGNVREWFKVAAAEWTRETGAHSSMTVRRRHRAYQAIVKLGLPVVPFLLEALRETPDMWFAALREITNENPVHPDDRGNYDKMSEAWIAWGRDNPLID